MTAFHSIIFSQIYPVTRENNVYSTARHTGVYRISTELRSLGWDVEVVDFFGWWKEEDLITFLKAKITDSTKFIGFSQIFPKWTEKAENVCRWIKENYPNMVIISGSSSFPYNMKSAYIDYYMQGYSEYSIVHMLDYLFANGPKPHILNFDNKQIILSNEHYLASPFRSPIIIYEDRDFLHPNEWVGIEFARGCKFKCLVCNVPVRGAKGDWTRDVDNTELQLKDAYDRFGIKHYIVSDETFNDRTDKITKYADIVEKLNFNPLFTGFIRADLLHARPRDKEELLRMGFLFHFYGIESFKIEAIRFYGKSFPAEKFKQCLLNTREYFEKHGRGLYRGTVSLVYGLPTETEESVMEGFNWLVQNWQGQNWQAHVLNITKPYINDINMKFNISNIGVDYAKHGYKEMHPKLVELRFKMANQELNTDWDSDIFWQNGNTNIFKWYDFNQKIIKEKQKYDFRLDNFSLSYLSETDTIEQKLAEKDIYGIMRENDRVLSQVKGFAQKYIDKKLGTI